MHHLKIRIQNIWAGSWVFVNILDRRKVTLTLLVLVFFPDIQACQIYRAGILSAMSSSTDLLF